MMFIPPSPLQLESATLPKERPDPDIATAAPRPAAPSLFSVASAHALRDFAGQELGRMAGLGVFVGLANCSALALPVKVLAGTAGALAAGTQAWLLAQHQIGANSKAAQAACMLCTLTAATAGCVVASLGTVPPAIALAIGGTATVAVSLMQLCLDKNDVNDTEAANTAKAVTLGVTVAASLTIASAMGSHWLASGNVIAERSMGLIFESSVIELCKSAFEQLGPSVDRNVLSFQGKAAAALAGALPYVVATVLFNGLASGMLQPAQDIPGFQVLLPAVLVGALANAVRGASNAVALQFIHQRRIGVARPDVPLLRHGSGVRMPQAGKVAQKAALRFFLSTCRNAVYFELRARGLSVTAAGCVAQFVYAWFAQSRDLLSDLMQGEGWH